MYKFKKTLSLLLIFTFIFTLIFTPAFSKIVLATGNTLINVTGVTLDKTKINLNVGQAVKLTETIVPADATNKNVSWTCSDNTVATVDTNGNVTGAKAGNTVITVTTADGNFTATCDVTVVALVDKIALSAAITAANTIYTNDVEGTLVDQYPAGSKAILQTSIDTANSILNKSDALQSDVDKAVTDLYTAITEFSNKIIVGVDNNGTLTATANKTSDMPEIDGNLIAKEGWNINTPILKVADATVADPNTNSAKFGTMWDNLYLYVGVDIQDKKVVEGNMFDTDDVEIFLDGLHNKSTSYESDDMQIGLPYSIAATQPVAFGGATSSTGRDVNDILRACKKTETGWSEEIAIPWSMIGVDPSQRKDIGLDVMVGNSDKVGGGYENSILWSGVSPDGSTPGWNNTSVFGNLNLSDSGVTSVNVTGISLDKSTSELNVGQAVKLTDTIAPANATNKTVAWTSSDNTVATVDTNGNITGVKAGSTIITATTADGSLTAICNVTVEATKVDVTGITLDKTTTNLNVGQTTKLTETVAPADATNKNVTWTSSDNTVATVDTNGNVTGVKDGNAVITVTTVDGSLTATCSVTVKASKVDVTGVTLDKTATSLNVGQVTKLTETVAPADSTNKNVAWTSSDNTIATVDTNGNVTGVKDGGAVIIATTADGNFTATCNVTVEEVVPVITEGNLFTLTTDSDFNKGALDNAVVTKNQDGEVQIAKVSGAYANKGVFTSAVTYTEPFSNLVASWNSDTPVGTSVGIEVQVLVDGQWSDWISWGVWSTNKERSSVNDDPNTKLAGIWTDTLYVKDQKTANAFRLRTTLNSTDPNTTPVLRAVNATIDLGSGAKKVYPTNEDTNAIENVDKQLDVPAFSQMIRDPQIAENICNATSATCVVDYYLNKYNQPNVLPEESAYAIYDSVYQGFGNWAFGSSYIGSFGLNSRVVYDASLYDLKREIYNGRPVVISINEARSENDTDPDVASFPIIHGFPIPATWGHMITVTGFKMVDGKEYVCVNDSAAASDAEVKRMYLADEFDAAWATSGRIAYTSDDLDGPAYNPLNRLQSVLTKTGNTEQRDAVDYSEIQLKYNGNAIDVSNVNAQTIMVSKDGGSYEYITPDAKTNLWFANNRPSGKYSFLIIAKDDKEYTADITWPVVVPVKDGDLSIEATASPIECNIGQNVVFNIVVTNAATTSFQNIPLNDLLPEGLTYVSDDSNGTYDPTTGIWNIGVIEAGKTVQLNITAKVTKHDQIDNIIDINLDGLSEPIEDCATIIGDDTAPTTVDYAVTTKENNQITGKVVGSDADNDILTYSLDNSHSGATVDVKADGSWTYTPGKDYYGDDSFTVKADDGNGGTTISTVTVTISQVNQAPIVENYTVSTIENVALTGKVSATDADGDDLTYTKASDPNHGTVDAKVDGTWIYTPSKNYYGADSFTVKVDDGNGGTDIATISISISAVATLNLQRLAGSNRIETSIAIAEDQYTAKKPDAVVLATASDFPDALSGSELAYKYNAPLLLVNKSVSSSKTVLDYITTNLSKNKNIYILGGTGAVSKEISDYLTTKGYKIIRLGGKDRYETNQKIVSYLNITKGTSMVIATGNDFADALSISSISDIKGFPILLNGKDSLSANVSNYITNMRPTTVYVIGQTGVLSTNIETQIKKLNGNIKIVRLGGKDRYETSMMIVDYFNLLTTTITVATGINFPDALSGSVLAARKNSGVLLIDNKDVTKQKELLSKEKIANIIVFGGEGVISKDIATILAQK